MLNFLDCEVIFDISHLELKSRRGKAVMDDTISHEFKIVGTKGLIFFYLHDVKYVLNSFRANSLSILEGIKLIEKELVPDRVFFDTIINNDYCYTRIDNWDSSCKMALFVKKISNSVFLVINVTSMEYEYEKLVDIGVKLMKTTKINTIA